MDIADVAGVDPKTYRKVRNRVYSVMAGSLREYWNRMQIEIREVSRLNRHAGPVMSHSRRIGDGTGFGEPLLWNEDGCYRAFPKKF